MPDKPKSVPDLYSKPAEEYNQILKDTYAYFANKRVRIPDGRTGSVVGVDPRPKTGGQDGNFLRIRVNLPSPKPGKAPFENVFLMPDDVELVTPPAPEPAPEETTTTTETTTTS